MTRSQVYRVRDWARPPAGFPFLTVASRPAATSAGEVDLPFLQSSARAVVCLFAVDAGRLGSLQDVRLGRRALVALTACDHREGSAGPYREVSLSVAVHSPWQAHHLEVWRDLLAPPAHRRAGVEVLERALTSERAEVAGRELWGLPGCVTESLSDVFSLRGRLGPGVPVPVTGTVIYSRLGGVRLRSCLEVSGAPGCTRWPPSACAPGRSRTRSRSGCVPSASTAPPPRDADPARLPLPPVTPRPAARPRSPSRRRRMMEDSPDAALIRDAHELAELAVRLRDLAGRLREDGVAPPWLDDVLGRQIIRCAAASAHLAAAARPAPHGRTRNAPTR